jgi:hypothetical protein
MYDSTRRPRRIEPVVEIVRRETTSPDQALDPAVPASRRFRASTGSRASGAAALTRIHADLSALRQRSSFHTPDGRPADAEFVIARLEEAGSTLLSLPESGFSPRMRTGALRAVHSAAEAYGWSAARLRPPVPSPERISRMDETFQWLGLIPDDRTVLRRLVSARSLVSPLTGKHLYAWRRLGALVGADHKAMQRWHSEGIRLIVKALNGA